MSTSIHGPLFIYAFGPLEVIDHCKAPLSIFIWKRRYINVPLYLLRFSHLCNDIYERALSYNGLLDDKNS